MLTLNIKRLDERAQLPQYESEGAAGLDLIALEPVSIQSGSWGTVRTGIAVEIPMGYEGQVRPRSGLAFKHGVTVLNAPGTIDSDYRGEIQVALINHGPEIFEIHAGNRIAQLVICPVSQAIIQEKKALNKTVRGGGGFGSTGS